MPDIARTTWMHVDCGWLATFDEPMATVYCVPCFHAGRGADHRCVRLTQVYEVACESHIFHTRSECPALNRADRYWPVRNQPVPTLGRTLCKLCERSITRITET